MTDNNTTRNKPGILRRIGCFILMVVVGVVILVPAIYFGQDAIWAGQDFLQSYFDMQATVRTLENRTDLMQDDIGGLMDASRTQSVTLAEMNQSSDTVGPRLAAVNDRLETTEAELVGTIRRQAAQIEALQAELLAMQESSEEQDENLALLNDSINNLQGDINSTNGQLDQLGGEFDILNSQLAALEGEVTEGQLATTEALTTSLSSLRTDLTSELQVPASQVARAMGIFRTWEFISRARLRLAENNLELAAADIQLALNSLALLDPDGSDETLVVVTERLELAAAGLPDNPAAATGDLDAAWSAMDEALDQSLAGILPLAVEETPAPADEETDGDAGDGAEEGANGEDAPAEESDSAEEDDAAEDSSGRDS